MNRADLIKSLNVIADVIDSEDVSDMSPQNAYNLGLVRGRLEAVSVGVVGELTEA